MAKVDLSLPYLFDPRQGGHTTRERLENLSIPEPNSGCWIWFGHAHENRHKRQTPDIRPKIWVGGRQGEFENAHKTSFQEYNGPIPEGTKVLHKCDNTLCINPDHLFLGTTQDNRDDQIKKGRDYWSNQTSCKRGHPFTVGNTYAYIKNGKLHQRMCRSCSKNISGKSPYFCEGDVGLTREEYIEVTQCVAI